MFLGVVWWALWRIVPRWFGYKVVSRKETLTDGTVVSLVRLGDWIREEPKLTEWPVLHPEEAVTRMERARSVRASCIRRRV